MDVIRHEERVDTDGWFVLNKHSWKRESVIRSTNRNGVAEQRHLFDSDFRPRSTSPAGRAVHFFRKSLDLLFRLWLSFVFRQRLGEDQNVLSR